MHDGEFTTLAEFLTARRGYYDAIWIARTHNLDRVKPLLEHVAGVTRRLPRIVLDTEAITSLRDATRAMLSGEKTVDVDVEIKREFGNATICQNIIAVNQDESQAIRDLGFSNVACWAICVNRSPRRTLSPSEPGCCSSAPCITRTVRITMGWSGSSRRFCR